MQDFFVIMAKGKNGIQLEKPYVCKAESDAMAAAAMLTEDKQKAVVNAVMDPGLEYVYRRVTQEQVDVILDVLIQTLGKATVMSILMERLGADEALTAMEKAVGKEELHRLLTT
jgi:hypothetical protein